MKRPASAHPGDSAVAFCEMFSRCSGVGQDEQLQVVEFRPKSAAARGLDVRNMAST